MAPAYFVNKSHVVAHLVEMDLTQSTMRTEKTSSKVLMADVLLCHDSTVAFTEI